MLNAGSASWKGPRLKTNYILIDYENVQPKNLAILNGDPLKADYRFKVIVFLGANQTKLKTDFADSRQALGNDGKYVRIAGNGPNALDFHIAFYIGKLAERDPDAYFHIISKDTGFDPLIKHLRMLKIRAGRNKALSEIPLNRISNASSLDVKIDAIVKNFTARGQSRPRKLQTLENSIKALFFKKIDEAESRGLIEELRKRKYVVVDNGKVSYRLPAGPS